MENYNLKRFKLISGGEMDEVEYAVHESTGTYIRRLNHCTWDPDEEAPVIRIDVNKHDIAKLKTDICWLVCECRDEDNPEHDAECPRLYGYIEWPIETLDREDKTGWEPPDDEALLEDYEMWISNGQEDGPFYEEDQSDFYIRHFTLEPIDDD